MAGLVLSLKLVLKIVVIKNCIKHYTLLIYFLHLVTHVDHMFQEKKLQILLITAINTHSNTCLMERIEDSNDSVPASNH